MIIRLRILNWDKFNPKRDQKTYSWLRLQNDIATDKDLYGLSAEQKWAWVVILCEASKKNSGDLEFDIEWLAEVSRVKKGAIESLLRFLEEKPIISKSLPPAVAECRRTTPTNERTNVTNERTNEYLPDSTSVEPRRVFDFESLYAKYPRKEGKQRGIAICKAQIRSQEDYLALSHAIDRYVLHVKKVATDPKYIRHFSTFMGAWRDWLEVDAGMTPSAQTLGIDWARVKGAS